MSVMKAWFVDFGEGNDMGVPYDDVYIVYADTRGKAIYTALKATKFFDCLGFINGAAYRIPGNFDHASGQARDNDPLWGGRLPILPRHRRESLAT